MPITDLEQKSIEHLAERNDSAYNSDENASTQIYVQNKIQNKILLEIVQQLKELRQTIIDGITVVEEK
jgi:dynactin complex subunit